MLLFVFFLLTLRLNRPRRHAGLDTASSDYLDYRLRGNDKLLVFSRRSNKAFFIQYIDMLTNRVLDNCEILFERRNGRRAEVNG